MKWSDLEKGQAGGRTVDLELSGGKIVPVRVVPLFAAQDVEIARDAEKFAVERGAPATVGHPVYELGVHVLTIVRACLDPDDGKAFFSGGVTDVLDPANGLDRDRIAFLFEVQATVQADFAPRGSGLTPAKHYEWLIKTAESKEGDILPFEHSPRAMQRTYHHGMARSYLQSLAVIQELRSEVERLQVLVTSLENKSSTGPSSPDIEKSSKTSSLHTTAGEDA